jgi:tripartite-type tricarboxylate transporter receptor subunit TctC
MDRYLIGTLALGAGLLAHAGDATAADFYEGKRISVIVSTPPGGAYDVYARMITQYWGNHIPGKPSFVVQNMPGGAGVTLGNHIYNVAPKDGTVIAATHAGTPTAPLLTPSEVKFDVRKLSWIGSATKEPYVGYLWNPAPIKTYEEAKTKQVIMGSDAIGSAGVDMVLISNELFKTKFKMVMGYSSGPQVKLAMERGEVHGTFANAWTALNLAQPDWVKENKVTLIIQHGFQRHPDLPNVPMIMDQAKTTEEKQILEVELARQEFAKPYFAPPDVPADRLAQLRRGFDAVIKDPGFRAAAEKAGLPLESPMTGEELAALMNKLSETPSSVLKRINDTIDAFAASGGK